MKAFLELNEEVFAKTRELLLKIAARPATLVVLLDTSLRVNLKGDLLIDEETSRKIDDISWILPLK